MDPFKTQLERMQAQLAALTPSQKMLTGALVAIMVMTLVWWGRYAGEPEMESLLPQAISAEELAGVTMALDAKGIKHVMEGDKLLVPADRKIEALAGLIYAHALPRNAVSGFDQVLKNINPFWSEKQTDEMWNHGREITAAQIISKFPDVLDCSVTIDPQQKVRIGASIEPTAGVTISTRGGAKVPQDLVESAADVVAGALATLKREKIHVVIDGRRRRVKGENDGGIEAGDQLEAIQKAETRTEKRIRDFLTIEGLRVLVDVQINPTSTQEVQTTFDKKNVVQTATQEHTRTQEGSSPAAGGESGAGSNTGLSVAGSQNTAAPPGPTNSQDESTTLFQVNPSGSVIHRTTPSGEPKILGAAIQIPLSYFTAMYQKRNKDVKDPTEQQMQPMIDAELAKTKAGLALGAGLPDINHMSVTTYEDFVPPLPGPQIAGSGLSMTSMVTGHVKEAVLGALALMSLFMVSSMVKRAVPAPVLAGAPMMTASSPGSPILDIGAHLAGQAGEAGNMLDGMELDDQAVRAQQMLDQVSSLVKESPDSAASLIKRWMNK
ncbi:MAG TPA: hypothetical protein VFC78_16425 [Tepidisphaeraceae bacterium]|nr:hypothetical protein [Tepidisphaeraceae bacterium]